MPHRAPTSDATFLRNPASQLMCLEDALRSGSAQAMRNALEAVARVRGYERAAADANLAPACLNALLDPSNTEAAKLQGAVAALIEVLAGTRRLAAQKMTRDRPEDEKTD